MKKPDKIIQGMNFYNCDCMEFMKDIPDKYYELAIVDPPYGIGFDGEKIALATPCETWRGRRLKNYKKKDWDNKTPTQEYFNELQRVSKNQIIWGGNYFADKLKPSGGWVIWEKGVPEGMSLSQAEMAWTSCLNSIKIVKVLWSGYKKDEPVDRIHPTQKPVALYKWLLKNYAKEGDKILDTHGGSMSIAIACHYMDYQLDLCELDKEYFDAGIERVENQTRQETLL